MENIWCQKQNWSFILIQTVKSLPGLGKKYPNSDTPSSIYPFQILDKNLKAKDWKECIKIVKQKEKILPFCSQVAGRNTA